MTKADDFRQLCRDLLQLGLNPTPLTVFKYGFGDSRNLNGKFTKIRTEELLRAGWTKTGARGRWLPPSKGR